MGAERRKFKRYDVSWRGRLVTADKQLFEIGIKDVSSGGVGIVFPYALTVGTLVSVEFYVRHRGGTHRIRAKTRVAFNTVLSDNRGAKLGLQFTALGKDELNTLNEVLHFMEENGY